MPADPMQSLTARVKDRVAAASRALDRRAAASRPKLRRPRKPLPSASTPATPAEPVVSQEAASLRSVFRELGDTHRQYRRRTGQSATPALREAANAFKQAPTLTTLVGVATFFDELGILEW